MPMMAALQEAYIQAVEKAAASTVNIGSAVGPWGPHGRRWPRRGVGSGPVMMPGEDRQRAAVGAPVFGKGAGEFFGRAHVMAEDAADLDLYGEVARRPDVGAALCEQQVDLCRPAADATAGRRRHRASTSG